jgi:inositol-phosphate transport system permease protein
VVGGVAERGGAADAPRRPAVTIEAPRQWARLARRARRRRWTGYGAIYAFLILVSVPLLIPYVALVVSAFGPRDPAALWRTLAVLTPWAAAVWLISWWAPTRRAVLVAGALATVVAALALAYLIGPELTLARFAFLLEPPGTEPVSFWTAFGNSMILALSQTAIVVTVASLAGFYISRFAFPGRAATLGALLVLHAFPVMTLIIPLFLMLYWVGLLNSLSGVILVLVALELPFAVYIMKGFFDAVPWDIEMSALVDGATRREAFVKIVLPQVRSGMIAVAIFTFIRGWEEYVFVLTFLVTRTKWVMSLYVFFGNNSPAVALVYLLPPLLLFLFSQRYLTRLAVGAAA